MDGLIDGPPCFVQTVPPPTVLNAAAVHASHFEAPQAARISSYCEGAPGVAPGPGVQMRLLPSHTD